MYASLLGISGAFYPGILEHPTARDFFTNLPLNGLY